MFHYTIIDNIPAALIPCHPEGHFHGQEQLSMRGCCIPFWAEWSCILFTQIQEFMKSLKVVIVVCYVTICRLSVTYAPSLSVFLQNSVQILSSFKAQNPYSDAYIDRDSAEIWIGLAVSQLCIPTGLVWEGTCSNIDPSLLLEWAWAVDLQHVSGVRVN